MYTVARRAGVSVATVSRVLQEPHLVREATQTKVHRAIDELDYVPHGGARSLASSRHEAHGLVLPELRGPYYSELLMGYESVAADAGHSVILLLTEGKNDLLRQLRRLAGNIDGLVMVVEAGMPGGDVAALRRQIPVLTLSGARGQGFESFTTESRCSAEKITRHLFGHGRRRLAFVGTPDQGCDIRERYEGFLAAHDGAPTAAPIAAELREREGQRVADDIVAGRHDVDSLVCANDELALALIDRLTAHGVRVPQDIAVVGWDDVMGARYIRPALTTVAQPVRALGAAAATRMRDLIGGAATSQDEHTLPTTLVIRQSCGCPEAPAHDEPVP
ncbi:MAG: LacI family DNA-binding transcriptional regulator [Ornithinimicrobium sp.]